MFHQYATRENKQIKMAAKILDGYRKSGTFRVFE